MRRILEQNLSGFPFSNGTTPLQIGQALERSAATCVFIKKVLANSCFFLFVGLLTFATNLQAKEWLQSFWCSDLESARLCSACSVRDSGEVRFTVRSNPMSVISQNRKDGVTQAPRAMANCTILDEKNWQCGSVERAGPDNIFARTYSINRVGADMWSSSSTQIIVPGTITRPPIWLYGCLK